MLPQPAKCPRLTQVSAPSLTMKRSTIQWHRMGPKPTFAHSAFLCKPLCRLLLVAVWLRGGIWVFFLSLARVVFHYHSRGCILHSLRVQGPNTPSGGSLRRPTKGGPPFSQLAKREASLAHRFHRKSPKSPKSAQKGGTPLFGHFFSKVSPLQTMLSIFEKKCGNPPPPSWTTLRGGISALFSEIRR